MSGAQLDAVELTGADLRKSNLRGAGFRNARLDGTDLRDARAGWRISRRGLTARYDLRGAYLRLAGLTAQICPMPIGMGHRQLGICRLTESAMG